MMQLPQFFIGSIILFWGWQTDLWWFALPMAVLYEASFWLKKARWHLTTANFRSCSHLCTGILVVVSVYLWRSDASLKFIFLFFQWLPVICFPLLVAQAYADGEGVDLQALLFFKDKPEKFQSSAVSLHYPFFAICLFAASAGNTRDTAFYLGVVASSAIALWFQRSQRSSLGAWIAVLFVAATIGFWGHLTLHQAHLTLEKKTMQWVRQFYRYGQGDPTQRSTAIGDIGSVKQSNSILLRVKPDQGSIVPKLLRKATYNAYNTGMWFAKSSQFQPLNLVGDKVNLLTEDNSVDLPVEKQTALTIYRNLEEGNNLISLPDGTTQISNLPVQKVQRNQYGSVQGSSEETRLAAYKIDYNRSLIYDSPPTEEDLTIPQSEIPALKAVVAELNLKGKSQPEIVNAVYDFFNTEFRYSLDLVQSRGRKTPLSAFLLNHRTGHCEYFATASALLLRSVGIPTRYAVGYSVHEYSSLEKQYIVRGKNAHAWNLVYLDGAWQELDPTPASWIAWETKRTSSFVAIKDFFSWFGFKLALFNELVKAWSQTLVFWIVAIPILALLLWWLLSRQKMDGIKLQSVIHGERDRFGADSEIYAIEQALIASGLVRHRADSWLVWLATIEQNQQLDPKLLAQLRQIIRLHYRYRFDPIGIDSQERNTLKTASQNWLHSYKRSLSKIKQK